MTGKSIRLGVKKRDFGQRLFSAIKYALVSFALTAKYSEPPWVQTAQKANDYFGQ